MCKENEGKPLNEGIQPDVYKGIKPNFDLDTSNPPGGGSGVETDQSGGSESSKSED